MIAKPPLNIWDRAPDVEVLLLSPEQLVSPSFEALLKDKVYQTRVVALGVDEVHLLNTWGQSFRREFEQIGLMRARFTLTRPRLIALTATLQTGSWFHSVCHFLGLHEGHFYLIRRSNMRYDLRFVFRTVISGARSHMFPELDWVLEGDRKIIVFCPAISMAHRIATYLRARSDGLEDIDQRIRMYNSLNWASYNSETLSFMHNDGRSRVTVATDALAVGIDVSGTDDVVLYDTVLPSDTDIILQKAGRIRDGRGRQSRVVVYLPKKAIELAQSTLKDDKKGKKVSAAGIGKKGRGGAAVDVGVARLVLASCKVDLLNKLYDNPETDKPCTCATCIAKPAKTRPERCTCSGCSPEDSDSDSVNSGKGTTRRKRARRSAPSGQKLTRAMRDHAHERLGVYRKSLREDCDDVLQDLYPPEEFLPDSVIDTLLDQCYTSSDINSLRKLLHGDAVLEPHLDSLQAVMDELRDHFDVVRAEARASKAAKAKVTREQRKAERTELAAAGGAEELEDEDSSARTEESETSGVYSTESEHDDSLSGDDMDVEGVMGDRGRRVQDGVEGGGSGGGSMPVVDGRPERLVIRIPGGRVPK